MFSTSKVQYNSVKINALLCIQQTIRLVYLKQWFNICEFNTSGVDWGFFIGSAHVYTSMRNAANIFLKTCI